MWLSACVWHLGLKTFSTTMGACFGRMPYRRSLKGHTQRNGTGKCMDAICKGHNTTMLEQNQLFYSGNCWFTTWTEKRRQEIHLLPFGIKDWWWEYNKAGCGLLGTHSTAQNTQIECIQIGCWTRWSALIQFLSTQSNRMWDPEFWSYSEYDCQLEHHDQDANR